MKLILTHDTALQLMRARREHGYKSEKPAHIRTLDDCAHTLKQVESFGLPLLVDNSKAVHVIAPSAAEKCRSRHHISHTMTGPLPYGAFYQEGNRVFSLTPEMLFFQQAQRMAVPELALFGLELCGTYTLSPDDGRFSNCPAATTRKRLLNFAQRMHPARGSARAIKSLRWVVDGSNSPMESALMLFLCLPVKQGGYGFPLPNMNPSMKLSKDSAEVLHQDTIRCDLHWLDKNVVVEYDSSEEHLKPDTAARDAERLNALAYEGTTVMKVTPKMIARPAEFDGVVKQLASALEKRLDVRTLDYSKERIALRIRLFPWLVTKRWT